MPNKLVDATPWDTGVFSMPTWELQEYSEIAISQALKLRGHHTVRVDPLADKRLLHESGFYYCDTLIEPYCNQSRLIAFHHDDASVSFDYDESGVLEICRRAFSHGRFHRDFVLSRTMADERYVYWLRQLIDEQKVHGLFWQKRLAGFIAHNDNKLVLHAVSIDYQGKGLTKYWWSPVSKNILDGGFQEVSSSISASNLAAINLYASIGYRFRSPKDIYHRVVA
jgi:hypothetical protein